MARGRDRNTNQTDTMRRMASQDVAGLHGTAANERLHAPRAASDRPASHGLSQTSDHGNASLAEQASQQFHQTKQGKPVANQPSASGEDVDELPDEPHTRRQQVGDAVPEHPGRATVDPRDVRSTPGSDLAGD